MTQKSTSESGQSNASTYANVPSGSTHRSADNAPANASQSFQAVARDLKDEVTGVAKDVAGEAKKSAESKLVVGKDMAVEQLGSFAEALRKTGKHLRTSDSPVTEYVEKAAASVDSVAHYLETRTLGQLLSDVQRYARREPAIFLGGAFFTGMLGGRFFKAATPSAGSSSAAAPSGAPTTKSSTPLAGNGKTGDGTSQGSKSAGAR